MSTQNENLFVKLIKKSVGLPTGKSDCCGAEGTQASSAGCGCGDGDCNGGCCGVEDEKESESSPAVGSSAI